MPRPFCKKNKIKCLFISNFEEIVTCVWIKVPKSPWSWETDLKSRLCRIQGDVYACCTLCFAQDYSRALKVKYSWANSFLFYLWKNVVLISKKNLIISKLIKIVFSNFFDYFYILLNKLACQLYLTPNSPHALNPKVANLIYIQVKL